MKENTLTLRVFDVVKALAFIGDLSMGQPTDHSLRVAWLAGRLAAAAGVDASQTEAVCEAALLRWSGCTANATEYTRVLGDDVGGREAMLAMRPAWDEAVDAAGGTDYAVLPLSRIHCEVSSEVGRILGLSGVVERTLRHIFECYDGSGTPDRLAGSAIPQSVFIVVLAGDLEVLSRNYEMSRTQTLIRAKAGIKYPAELVELLLEHAANWLRELDAQNNDTFEQALLTERMRRSTAPELIADVVDLKLPWMTGFSRRVARSAGQCCAQLGVENARSQVYCAGLIHGLGRAAIPNTLWTLPTALPVSAWEKIRLAPYWTSRAGKQIPALAAEADIASYGYERLDGSGYFRGVSGSAIPLKGQILAAAIAWEALRSPRPWRNVLSVAEATAMLWQEVESGRFERNIVENIINPTHVLGASRRKDVVPLLSPRETEVLRHISLGASNKEAARSLQLSPSTVATHLESVFRKLRCSTRAAATLKASTLGLL